MFVSKEKQNRASPSERTLYVILIADINVYVHVVYIYTHTCVWCGEFLGRSLVITRSEIRAFDLVIGAKRAIERGKQGKSGEEKLASSAERGTRSSLCIVSSSFSCRKSCYEIIRKYGFVVRVGDGKGRTS